MEQIIEQIIENARELRHEEMILFGCTLDFWDVVLLGVILGIALHFYLNRGRW